MNREARRQCMRWVCEYLILQQKAHVIVTASDICEALALQPGSGILISSFLKSACYSRNNRGYHVKALHSNPDRKTYSIVLRPSFSKLAEKVLDD